MSQADIPFTTSTDPISSAAVTTDIIDSFSGTIITTTAAGNAQTMSDPTNTEAGKSFTVVNNDTSSDDIAVEGINLEAGRAQRYVWDGTAWVPVEAVDMGDITNIPAGTIVATNGQAAINELDTEKQAALTAPIDDKASPGEFGAVAPGALSSQAKEIVQATTDTLTAAEMSGTFISNFGQGAANTQTLPTAAAGLNCVFQIFTTGNAFHVKAGATDKIYFDGTALDDADKVSLATPAAGDFITFAAFKTGASTWDWLARTGNGTWTDGGA